jgi:hypothetical protein
VTPALAYGTVCLVLGAVLGVQAGRWSVYAQSGFASVARRLVAGWQLFWDGLVPCEVIDDPDPWA